VHVIGDGGPELAHDRSSMRAARDDQCNSHGPFGPTLQHCKVIGKEGGELLIPIAHAFALLHASMLGGPSLQRLFGAKLVEHPCSPGHPWKFIIYSDEVTVGNVLSTSNRRKLQAVYLSWLELDQSALSHEECWWCMMVELSSTVNTVAAIMSQVFGAFLRKLFDQDGLDISTSGVPLAWPASWLLDVPNGIPRMHSRCWLHLRIYTRQNDPYIS